MLAFCRGDEEAFISLYRRYRDRIANHARRLLGDQARGEEASQEVFIKLYQARTRYEPRSRFSTFVFRIATNHCLNLCARLDHKLLACEPPDDQQVVNGDVPQDERIAQEQLRKELSRALATLPNKQRAALVLCHYEGLSYQEAAETLEVSESALKSLVFRARQAMIKQMEQYVIPEGKYAV